MTLKFAKSFVGLSIIAGLLASCGSTTLIATPIENIDAIIQKSLEPKREKLL